MFNIICWNMLHFQSKANVDLELKTFMMKYDQEVLAHKETVARFNVDKKTILMSTEEANLEAIKGIQLNFTKTLQYIIYPK